jgi:Cys-tRNA(Pro) deacylase
MKKGNHVSATPATEWLKKQGVPFEEYVYTYEDHGGTALAAKSFGVDEHMVIKTLIMEDETGAPIVILMHGDCEVSTKQLARQVGCKEIHPCTPQQAQRNSGYMVGGTSPFATRKNMPVYVQKSILELPRIFINGGKRGFNIAIDPSVLKDALKAKEVDCAI